MGKRHFPQDEGARVPFAMVAVLILMMSAFSMTYIGGVQRQQAGLRMAGLEITRQDQVMHQLEERMAMEGYYIASKAVLASTQLFCNETMLDSCYSDNYSAYLESTFPFFIDPYRVEIRDFVSAVFLEEQNIQDIIPSNKTTEKNITLKDGSGEEFNGTINTMDTATMGELNETTALARYVVVGGGNCTITNVRSGAAMERPIAFQRDIQTPFPLMNSKMTSLDNAGSNSAMGIARVVKYILTTLAQFRVLEGYGSGLDSAPGEISDIISMNDVRLAVNLAVLLETSRIFRGYDAGIIPSLENMGLGASGHDIASLLKRYMNNGSLDASDIVAIYIGIGDREIPVDIILAQAFNAIADQFILKYLDYFGIMDIANDVYKSIQSLGKVIEDAKKTLSTFLLSDDGEAREESQQVTGWIAKLETNWPPGAIAVPGITISTGSHSRTDLAVLGVYQPINSQYIYSGNCSQLMGEKSSPILDTDSIIIGTRYDADLRSSTVSATTLTSASSPYPLGYLADFIPASLLRTSSDIAALWADFYNEQYAAQEDVIYDSIRDAVKNVTAEMARLITNFIGQDSISLSEYANGEYAIDPNDQVSALENVRLMVDSVMEDATRHLQSNPGAVASMLSVLTSKHAQLTISLMKFISENYDVIVNRNSCLESATESLSRTMLLNSSVVVSPALQHTAAYSIYNDIGHSRGFSDDPIPYNSTETPNKAVYARILMEQNIGTLNADMAPHSEAAFARLREAESAWHYFGSPDNGLYIKALEGAVQTSSDSILSRFMGDDPSSFVGMASDMVIRVLDGIIWSGEVSNTHYSPEMMYSNESRTIPFEIYENDYSRARNAGNIWEETFAVTQPEGALRVAHRSLDYGADFPSGTLGVNISAPSGVHFTDVTSINERPFENRWNVTIRGEFLLAVSSRSLPYISEGAHLPATMQRTVEIDLSIPVLAYSGWDLAGVNYTDTASLAGDAKKLLDIVGSFFDWVWGTIAGPIDWIIDQIMLVVDFFSDIIGTLLSYASKIMNIVTEIIGSLVEEVQNFLRDVAERVFDSIMDWIIDLLPDKIEFRFDMFGFDFLVSFGSKSEIENASSGKGGKLVSVETVGSLFGAGMLLGLDFIALSDEVAEAVDVNYDLLLWSQIELDGFLLDINIDPFMVIQEHIVECRGQGNGVGLNINAPVVMQQYHSVMYSLHDIPGLKTALSNIPVPIPGMKATVNAGLEILYTLRGIEADHPVINEVELNPRGETAGNQWVEIYNPTDAEVSMDNWTLGSSTHSEFNRTFNSTYFLDPGGYFMVHYFNETLPQESVTLELLDSQGKKLDSSPVMSEADSSNVEGNFIGPAGSQMTWQRSPNGANLSMVGKWTFGNGTIGSENAAINISFKSLVWNLLKGAWNSTWQDLKDELALSLDFIVKLVKQFIQRFIDDVLKVIARSVVETSMFLDIMLTDASGTGGTGIVLSFVIEGGDTLAAILRWVIGSVAAYLSNIGKPTQPGRYPQLAPEIPEHLFIRLDFYCQVQMPKMVKGASQSGKEPESIKMIGRIEANIPALAALAGREMGRWRINFGVYVEKMPAKIADPLFGTGDATPDVWLFKGTVWEC